MKRPWVLLFAMALLCGAGVALAQVAGDTPRPGPQLTAGGFASDAPPSTPEWGIASRIAYVVPCYSWINLRDAQHTRSGGYMYWSAGDHYFDQTIHLPSGALVDGVTLYYFDADAGADAGFYFYWYHGTSQTGFTSATLLTDTSTGSSGLQGGYRSISPTHTVRNYNPDAGETSHYLMVLSLAPSGSNLNLGLAAATIWYSLQISPAPATATFSDVPTGYWAFRHIEALAASGITAGCAPGLYCPENTVTRAEMAVFLAKALGLHWPDASQF